jgi:hypothetical protein
MPRILWATIWVVLSLGLLSAALRIYAVNVEKVSAD